MSIERDFDAFEGGLTLYGGIRDFDFDSCCCFEFVGVMLLTWEMEVASAYISSMRISECSGMNTKLFSYILMMISPSLNR